MKNLSMMIVCCWGLVALPVMAQTQFPWPVTPFNQSQEITGTFCEYRSTSANGHFHNGTDIPKADGSPCYAVKDGVVSSMSSVGSNAFVRVDELAYVHIMPTPSLSVGDSVFALQTIVGTILPGLGHVHLTNGYSGAERNSMLTGSGLTPYNDPWAPIIRSTSFYADNSDRLLSSNSLSGKVDIMVKVDEQNGSPSSSLSRRNNGTYEIGYKILNAAGDSVVYEPSANGIRFRFNTKPSNSYVNRVFYRPQSSTTSHVYQVTNNINADFFWNTELLPYGDYIVMVFTRDTRNNTDTTYTPVTTVEPDLIPPDAPLLTSAVETDDAGMLITWKQNTDDDLLGYRLYFSFDNADWALFRNEATLTAGVTELEIPQTLNQDVYYRLAAVDNAPGIRNESAYSDVYGLSNGAFSGKILLVDGFDRTDGRWTAGQHDFLVRAGQAVIAAGYSFDSVPNESVVDSIVQLSAYDAVFWLLGDESVSNETFDGAEQAIVMDYLSAGGKLFLSGSRFAWDLDGAGSATASDRGFLNEILLSDFDTSIAAPAAANTVSGSFLEGLQIDFGQQNYAPDSVDVLSLLSAAQPVLEYDGGQVAGLQFTGTIGTSLVVSKLIAMTIPIETIDEDSVYAAVIGGALEYFFGVVAIDEPAVGGPSRNFLLSANYPNPFNPETSMEFVLPRAAQISLVVYNLLGQPVKVLASGQRQAGTYRASWDGHDQSGVPASSGIYLVRFFANPDGGEPVEQVRKMTLLR